MVMKFGGTSVGSAERIREVVARVKERRGEQPLVVVSALAGVTDHLLGGADAALARSGAQEAVVEGVRERHLSLIHELVTRGV